MILRYGYTNEQQKRVSEIDEKLAQFESERQQYLQKNTNSSTSSLNVSEEKNNEQGKLPILGKGLKNDEEKEIHRPEKVIGDNYLKEQVHHLIFFSL